MKLIKLTPQKSKAQAIVEFAIALPVLLLLLYGLLETGRYLFLYSTVVNASRQAVRYGSATGIGDGGVLNGNAGVPRYQDCNGIRARATNGAYIANFDSIIIRHDDGVDNSGNPINEVVYCSGATDTSFVPSSGNNSRITVQITERYTPIVPRIVPFAVNDIVATSSRTILLSVSIEVTAPSVLGGSSPTSSASATMTPSASATPSRTATPTFTNTPITFTPTRTYTPTVTLTPSRTNTPTNTFTPTYTFTPSFTPTPSATPISNCNLVAHGSETISGKNLTMTINNPTGVPLSVLDITVFWNHDGGSTSGSLRLREIVITDPSGSNSIWSGNIYSTSFNTIPSNLFLAPGTSTIEFRFQQNYVYTDDSERIFVNLGTNGCQLYPIDSNN